MANTITLFSISELLGRNFFIPSYQRGYRWTNRQVEDLLNDIYAFASKKGKTDKEFYCLQPVVVKKHEWDIIIDENTSEKINGWEVVDGQQRLTTIRILFTYFIKTHLVGKSFKERYNKELFTLNYETRKDTEDFINNISENKDDNIDFHHISNAYSTIVEWFKMKVENENLMLDDLCDTILRTLIFNQSNKKEEGVVQVIWYEIKDNDRNNAIDTFIRINLGRISLTNSELIKALFLQERFFGNEKDQNEIAKLRQLEIANEWDRIENMLQDEDFWWFLNKDENKVSSRIEFIFELICSVSKKKDPSIETSIGTDRYSIFRFFYDKFEKQIDYETLKKEWDLVKEYFLTFEEWYNDPVWYHYIGFLVYCGESIENIYEYTKYDSVTKLKIETKNDISISLKKIIIKRFQKVEWKFDIDGEPFINLTFNDKNKQTIRELLLLFNLEYIVQQCKAKTIIYKFPFKTFKEILNENGTRTSWDVEHIDSFTTNPLINKNAKIEWLNTAMEDVEIMDIDLKIRAMNFIENSNSNENFENLQKEITELVEDLNENDESTKNNIGNLTLLDAGTNRGYGNSLFPTKRRKIIEKDKKGVFIPICTKNVFLKYFDTKGSLRNKWTLEDMSKYRNVLTNTLIEFLPVKPKNKKINEQV